MYKLGQIVCYNATGKHYQCVNVTVARKGFLMGQTVMIAPSKLNINNPYILPVFFNNTIGWDFDTFVNHYIHYNCTKELGKNPVYFVEC